LPFTCRGENEISENIFATTELSHRPSNKGRSNISFAKWMELDMEYIDNWSLGLDLMILLKTVPAVFKGSGAS